MNFQFATAGRIVFGPGVLKEAAPAAAAFGRRAFLVTGRDVSRAERLRTALRAAGVSTAEWAVPGEPTTDTVECAAAAARREGSEFVIGFGGGSAIDAAKAVAALATNAGPITDYIEVIGAGKPLEIPSLPCIAIPTTAGTGSEATRNAVLASPRHRLKVSLRGPYLLPKIAFVDPELTLGLPPGLTAATGLDALTQLVEPFVCSRANPITDGLCREGLARVARSLRRAFERPDDRVAREEMAAASLFGGLALANAGLGAVHGFASPVGGRFGAPHGAICGALLAPAMETNLRAGASRDRYTEVARLLAGRPGASAEDGVAWVRALKADLKIPGLRSYGVVDSDAPALAAQAANTSSMKANPIPLSAAALEALLRAAL
ncbi:MAG: iron-containing alcohol dehydrogenase [Opitutaceae bacterium]